MGRRFAFLMGLACFTPALYSQITYTSVPGKTSISTNYDPNAPAPKAPENPENGSLPALPVGTLDQYLAQKDQMAQYSQLTFVSPATLETVTAPGPRAPGAAGPQVGSTPTFSWQGLQNTGLQPPSPNIAVGPSDVLMVVNSNIGQFSKAGTLKKLTSFQDWFASILPNVCANNCLIFDPWIVYDQQHGHFLFLAGVTPSGLQSRTFSYLLLSVSNGATYDGGWKTWALNASIDGNVQTTNWGDFWRLGFDNVAVYLSGNMYNTTGTLQYAKMRVLKKSDVYNPNLTTLPYQEFGSANIKLRNSNNTLADSLLPIIQRGQPTGGAIGLFVNAANIPSLPANFLTVWKISDPLASPLTVTQTNIGGLLSYNVPAPAPQLGTGATLDSGDTRVLKAIYRNGFLYTARDTGYPDAATTVTYDLIDTSTMKATSQSRLLNTNAFYPAFDIPATTPLGTPFYTPNLITGTTTAPNGTLTYAGITNLKAGEGPFDVNFGAVNRWGDYFGGAIDPISGGLWVSGQYAKPALAGGFGQWGTWAGMYPWLTTATFNDVPSTSPFFDYTNVLSSWQITSGCSTAPSRFCPTDLVTRDQLAVLIVRSMFGNDFTFSPTPHFTDVPSTSVYFPFIQKLADLGISAGCTATTFCPSGNVPRMDAAVLIVRSKLKALFGDEFTYPKAPFFTDVTVDMAQFSFVQKMYELGLTTGCTPTKFCPDGLLTRQEIAVFLTRGFLN